MTRLKKFQSFESHGWLCRLYKRLKPADIRLAEEFIAAKDHLDKDEFEMAVNRMFMDCENKPAKWTLIIELLANANV